MGIWRNMPSCTTILHQGPFIYYVSTFLGFLDPPSPLYIPKHVLVKFIYSEKATKFCEISTLLLCYVVIVVPVKSKVEISQTFVAFSEYLNFNKVVQNWSYQQFIFTKDVPLNNYYSLKKK